MFHIQAYQATLGINAANVALNSVADTIFTPRNNAFVYTEQWFLAMTAYFAAHATECRMNLPKVNTFNRHNVFGLNLSLDPPSPMNLQDMRKEPLGLSINENLIWEGSNNLGAANEDSRLLQWLVSENWSMDFPQHLQRISVRFAGTEANVADSWSAGSAITFPDQALRGGVYSIVGCQCQQAAGLAYRFILPRQKPEKSRLLRPGGPLISALGNIVPPQFNGGFGEWGRFHTFELPQIQILGDATGAANQIGVLDLLYLGEDESLLDGTL